MNKTLQKYEVATIQYEPSQFNKDHNINSLILLCEKAAEKGAKLIVTPEMGTTGYCFLNREEISSLVEEIPGPTTKKFQEIAKKFNCFIVVPLLSIIALIPLLADLKKKVPCSIALNTDFT